LIVDLGARELPLLVRGPIRLQHVTPAQVLELPPLLGHVHPFKGVLSLDGIAMGVIIDLRRLEEQAIG
jgi:hypothetical protein